MGSAIMYMYVRNNEIRRHMSLFSAKGSVSVSEGYSKSVVGMRRHALHALQCCVFR